MRKVVVPRVPIVPKEDQTLTDAHEENKRDEKRQEWREIDTRRLHEYQQRGRDIAPIRHVEDELPF